MYQGDIEAVAKEGAQGVDRQAVIEQISGSDEFAERYTENGRAKQRAEDEAHTSFTKKKSLMTQKKQMREQKEEAEKHLALLEQINDMKVEGDASNCITLTPISTARATRKGAPASRRTRGGERDLDERIRGETKTKR